MLELLLIFIAIGISMQVVSIKKLNDSYNEINGIIRSHSDLLIIKEAINLNMKLAILYLASFVLLIIILIIKVRNGMPISTAGIALSTYGMVTFPISLFGKKYENKIRSIHVQTTDPQIEEKFHDYLNQWSTASFQLHD